MAVLYSPQYYYIAIRKLNEKINISNRSEEKQELHDNINKDIITINASTNRIVNHETGEVTQTVDNKVVRLSKEPDFIKVYLQDINKIFELPKGCTPALYEILKQKVDNLETN